MRNSANPSMPDTNIHSGMKSVKESAGHAQEAAAVLEARDLCAGYGKKKILDHISFRLAAGEIMAVIGPNGTGKSTLLRTAAGFLSPISGSLYLHGSDISSMKPDQIARVLSVVTTERPDPEWMTVYEMTATGRYPYTGRMGILSPQDRQIVEEAMELLSVSALADTYFSSLSDGQKQRVMLARSIAQQPDLILMDEPTSFLDIRYRLEFAEMARMLAREKDIALLISIHEIDLAEQVADRILCLKNGRIQAAGRPEAVLTDSCLEELFDISPGTYHNRYIRKT